MTIKYKFTLGAAAKEFAEKQLNETEESRDRCIEEIREWLEQNQWLNAKTDDLSILHFLRGCKFNIERTKEKLENYYVMRAERPEWFTNRDPLLPEIKELVRLGVFVPLRKFQDNRLIVIIRAAAHDPKRHDINDVFKAGKMLLDIAAKENEQTSIYGVTAVFDMKGISLAHVRQLPPSLIKKAVYAWQNYHCRPKQLEFVNAPLYVNVVLRIFKRYMSDKLRGRVNVHFRGLGALHTAVSKENLPVEYGGEEERLQDLIEHWCQKVVTYRDWFREDEKFRADLSNSDNK